MRHQGPPTWSFAAIAAGLLLTPVLASEWQTGTRSTGADVVSQANAYLKFEDLAPSLNLLNAYTDDAARYTHRHVSGVTMDLVISENPGNGRFDLLGTSATISSGETHTAQVLDTDGLHTPGSFSFGIKVDATLKKSGSVVGLVSYTRSITVVVT